MNFMNLRYFLEAARHMNFTSAAKNLNISQQSLSNHIGRLEEEFGVDLFERTPKLKLTYAGLNAVRMAKQIVDLENQFTTQLCDIAGQKRGSLTIGISHMRSLVYLPDVLPEFKRRFPEIEIHLVIDVTKKLAEMLVNEDLDLVVGFNPFYKEILDKVDFHDILDEHLCLVVPNEIMKARFPSNYLEMVEVFAQGVDIAAFSDMPFIMVAKGNRIRDLSDAVLLKHCIKPKVILECPDLETLLILCIRGMGITFGFESVARMHGAGFVASAENQAYVFPIMEPEVQGKIVIGYKKGRYLSQAARDFINLSVETFRDKRE